MIETHYDCPCLEKCPLNYAMSIIGGKWKMQIICALNNQGRLRYNELRRKLDGISNTVLASSLKELEEAGLVERNEYLEVPVRVEYCSTQKADRLMPVLEAFSQWGEEMMVPAGEGEAPGGYVAAAGTAAPKPERKETAGETASTKEE